MTVASGVTAIGNLVDDPELRYTSTGVPVTRLRVAINERYQDNTGQWRDGDTTFLPVVCWRRLAENTAESLRKGDPVLVIGRLRQRGYVTEAGEKRTVYEVDADAIGPNLTTTCARPVKATNTSRDSQPQDAQA